MNRTQTGNESVRDIKVKREIGVKKDIHVDEQLNLAPAKNMFLIFYSHKYSLPISHPSIILCLSFTSDRVRKPT